MFSTVIVLLNTVLVTLQVQMLIYTSRLILRNFIPDEYERLRERDSDPAVLRYQCSSYLGPDMTSAFLDQAQQSVQDDIRTFYAYAVGRLDTK